MQISIGLGLALGAFAVTTQSGSPQLTGKKVADVGATADVYPAGIVTSGK